MDIQLQDLIDKIKREGREAAESEAARIVSDAQARGASIVAEAEKEAAAIRKAAEADAARAEASGKAAVGQAARDLVLAFKDGIAAALAAVVRSEVSSAYGLEAVKDSLPLVLKALAANGPAGDLEVLVPPEQAEKLDAFFGKRLAEELKRGLVIRPFPGLDAGFRIAERGGAAYYDFSASELAELFARRLNPRLAESIRAAAKGI